MNNAGNISNICSFCGKIIPPSRSGNAFQSSDGHYICKDCIVTCYNYIMSSCATGLPDSVGNITPRRIKNFLDEYVVGQENAKKAISVAIYNHYKRIANISETEIEKSNILLVGPTGTGKTFLVQSVAKILGVPLVTVDATSYTQAGYVGDNVEDIIRKLVICADYNIEKAQRGIVYIDEIDKIARRSDTPSSTKDVNGDGVQHALLKLLEGKEIDIEVPSRQSPGFPMQVKVDTRNILFIAGGAFAGIDRLVNRRNSNSRGLGFSAELAVKKERSEAEVLEHITPSDIISYGLTPEIMGRLPRLVTLKPLDEDDLVKVITEPKNSILKQYRELFAADNITLMFDDGAVRAVAKRAIKNGAGARGIRAIMEDILQDLMFELPDRKNVRECIISRECVEGTAEPTLVCESRKAAVR